MLLAWAINGEPLAVEHGAPLRVVVPATPGFAARNGLAIRVQDKSSDALHKAEDYHLFPPDMRKETQDPSLGITINEMPLTSAICIPAAGAAMKAGGIDVRCYVIAPIARSSASTYL